MLGTFPTGEPKHRPARPGASRRLGRHVHTHPRGWASGVGFGLGARVAHFFVQDLVWSPGAAPKTLQAGLRFIRGARMLGTFLTVAPLSLPMLAEACVAQLHATN